VRKPQSETATGWLILADTRAQARIPRALQLLHHGQRWRLPLEPDSLVKTHKKSHARWTQRVAGVDAFLAGLHRGARPDFGLGSFSCPATRAFAPQ